MSAAWGNWLALAVGSALFAALTAMFAKLGVEGMSSNLATLVRTAVVLAMTTLLVSARGEWSWTGQASARSVAFLVMSGLATGLSWLCYFRALQLAPVSLVAPVDKLSVVFAMALGVALLGEPLTWRLAMGGALIVAGVLVIATT